jgi:hypothetical protein
MAVEYDVIHAQSLTALIEDINHRLATGWVCQGGIAIIQGSEIDSFIGNFYQEGGEERIKGIFYSNLSNDQSPKSFTFWYQAITKTT